MPGKYLPDRIPEMDGVREILTAERERGKEGKEKNRGKLPTMNLLGVSPGELLPRFSSSSFSPSSRRHQP